MHVASAPILGRTFPHLCAKSSAVLARSSGATMLALAASPIDIIKVTIDERILRFASKS
jgi:hypothetical protein